MTHLALRPPIEMFAPPTTMSMMELREAPGEVLERIWWKGERFVLERAGKPMAYIFGKHDFDALLTVMLKVLPCLIPCLFCAVEIMPNGVARHEDSCPAFLFKKWKDSLESSAKGGKKR